MWKRLLRFIKKAVKKRPARKKRASSRKGRRRAPPARWPRRPARRPLKKKKPPRPRRSPVKKKARRPRRSPVKKARPSRLRPAVKRKKVLSARRRSGPKKRPAAKKVPAPAAVITHYYPKVRAAVLDIKRAVQIGDPVWIKGATTDFRQTVGSLQIDRRPITTARPGQEVGLEVMRDVRPGDTVTIIKGRP